ncbi:hypothetical protein PQX77_002869, partial [Marasmius sp. AFHP31]
DRPTTANNMGGLIVTSTHSEGEIYLHESTLSKSTRDGLGALTKPIPIRNSSGPEPVPTYTPTPVKFNDALDGVTEPVAAWDLDSDEDELVQLTKEVLFTQVQERDMISFTPTASIHRLPPEILCYIFLLVQTRDGSYIANFGDEVTINLQPLILSHVCVSWRAHVLSFPSLWSKITMEIDAEDPETWSTVESAVISPLQFALERCGNHALNLDLWFSISMEDDARPNLPIPGTDLFHLLSRHAHRWKDLAVIISSTSEFGRVLHPLNILPLSLKSPLLESLSVRSLLLPHSLLAHSPRLHTLSLHNDCLFPLTDSTSSSFPTTFPQIQHLTLDDWDRSLVLRALSSFPHLHSLRLLKPKVSTQLEASESPIILQFRLDFLQSLTIMYTNGVISPLGDILTQLELPSLQTLELVLPPSHHGSLPTEYAVRFTSLCQRIVVHLLEKSGCQISSLRLSSLPLAFSPAVDSLLRSERVRTSLERLEIDFRSTAYRSNGDGKEVAEALIQSLDASSGIGSDRRVPNLRTIYLSYDHMSLDDDLVAGMMESRVGAELREGGIKSATTFDGYGSPKSGVRSSDPAEACADDKDVDLRVIIRKGSMDRAVYERLTSLGVDVIESR